MAPEQRRQALLAVLAIILAGVAIWLWNGTSPTTAESQTASNVRNPGRAKQTSPGLAAPVVRLDTLESPKPEPGTSDRNPFRFKQKPAPPPPPMPVAPPRPVVPPPTSTASGVPTITLKFIGMWELSEQKRKIAMLTDGKGGVPIYGEEGDVVEGRYKILKIGVESIEMAYLDGRGRQTIRLSGQ
jgi:type IV secretory pathway VirB10-like protein